MDIAWIDLETTVLSTKEDRIVQMAVIIGTKEYEWIFNPQKEISEGAFNVHKISNEDVINKKPFKDYALEIYELLEDRTIGGYNIRF